MRGGHNYKAMLKMISNFLSLATGWREKGGLYAKKRNIIKEQVEIQRGGLGWTLGQVMYFRAGDGAQGKGFYSGAGT